MKMNSYELCSGLAKMLKENGSEGDAPYLIVASENDFGGRTVFAFSGTGAAKFTFLELMIKTAINDLDEAKVFRKQIETTIDMVLKKAVEEAYR